MHTRTPAPSSPSPNAVWRTGATFSQMTSPAKAEFTGSAIAPSLGGVTGRPTRCSVLSVVLGTLEKWIRRLVLTFTSIA